MNRWVSSGLGQATPPAVEVSGVDDRLYPWFLDPQKAEAAEPVALYLALLSMQGETDVFIQKVDPVVREIMALRAGVDERSRYAASLKRPGGLGGFSLKKSFKRIGSSITKPISDAGRAIDKAVFQPAAQPFKDAGAAIDKAVFQPIKEPIEEFGRQIDKAIIQPVMDPVREFGRMLDKTVFQPIDDTLKITSSLEKLDKYTIRPAGGHIAKGIAFLDEKVPGWTTLLDFIIPIPLAGSIVGQLSKMIVSGNVVARLAPGWAATPGGAMTDAVVRGAAELAAPVTVPIGESMTSIATAPFAQFSFTITKGAFTFVSTKGDFLTKLQATAIEAINGFALAIKVASLVLTLGLATPAMMALQASLEALSGLMTVLQAGITVLKAQEAAKIIRKQADAVLKAAQEEAARLKAEQQKLDAQIAELMKSIDDIRRQREALQRQMNIKKQATVKAAKVEQARAAQIAAEATVIDQAADAIGVSPEVLIASGFGVAIGLLLILYAITDD